MKQYAAHRHGGEPDHYFKRFKIPQKPVIDFSVNVNPLGPPPQLKKIWSSLYDEIKLYPGITGEGVKDFYQEKFDLHPNQILPGNGASEVIYLAFQALSPKKIVIITPSFHDYSRAACLNQTEIRFLKLNPEDNFKMPDRERLEQEISEADALCIGQPNNPTATMLPRSELLYLASRYPEKWIFVDEAFIQFVDNYRRHSLLLCETPPNVLIFHSLTKYYALSGLRIGSVISHPETIARMQSFKIPWSVNRLAEKTAPLLTYNERYEKKTREIINGGRKRMYCFLKELPGIKVFPSTVNFLLAQWTATYNLDDLLKPLLAEGIYIRDCRNFPGLEKNYFRFAVLTTEKNTRLLSALQDIVERF